MNIEPARRQYSTSKAAEKAGEEKSRLDFDSLNINEWTNSMLEKIFKSEKEGDVLWTVVGIARFLEQNNVLNTKTYTEGEMVKENGKKSLNKEVLARLLDSLLKEELYIDKEIYELRYLMLNVQKASGEEHNYEELFPRLSYANTIIKVFEQRKWELSKKQRAGMLKLVAGYDMITTMYLMLEREEDISATYNTPTLNVWRSYEYMNTVRNLTSAHRIVLDAEKNKAEEILIKSNQTKRITQDKGASRRLGGIFQKSAKIWETESIGVFGKDSKAKRGFIVRNGNVDADKTSSSENETLNDESFGCQLVNYLEDKNIIFSTKKQQLRKKTSVSQKVGENQGRRPLKTKLAYQLLQATGEQDREVDDAIDLFLLALSLRGEHNEFEKLVTKLLEKSDHRVDPFYKSGVSAETKAGMSSTEMVLWKMDRRTTSLYLQSLRMNKQWDKEKWAFREVLLKWRLKLGKITLLSMEVNNNNNNNNGSSITSGRDKSKQDPKVQEAINDIINTRWKEGMICGQHVYALLMQGKLDEAIDVVHELSHTAKVGIPSAVYNAIIRILAVSSDENLEKAVGLLKMMEKKTNTHTSDIFAGPLIPHATKETFAMLIECVILNSHHHHHQQEI
ncbi:hypothetical protein AX774_g3126 [Zancudomyces culisetae]|uniref:Uncharacterized protein n=1 Tax=Zancudomyces culisetae TaxID=1213189 RepID=A0A1R1PQV0_ZANCU|nr:hypothetical protein AX774_g3126 [Zancudomyces culisetae]|eukprot:OMH83366.1 hypothetical protein AX774_g3126 [Zancudomyces culisetae]